MFVCLECNFFKPLLNFVIFLIESDIWGIVRENYCAREFLIESSRDHRGTSGLNEYTAYLEKSREISQSKYSTYKIHTRTHAHRGGA